MAEGYARATGKPGVVLVTSPYGITSLVTPMQDALCDGTPMVVLSSLSPSISLGRDEFQVPDTLGIASACTKWSSRVAQIGELEQKINDAFEIALSGRPGPVLVDIPASIMNEQLHHPYGMSPLRLRRLPPISTGVLRMPPQDLDQTLTEVARLVDGARKPVLYVGQGMLARPEGPAILKEFADKANIPVTTSLQGLGAFDEHDPKSLHMLGLHGSGYANLAVQEADLIIALGARFDDRVTGSIPKFAPQALAAAFENRGGIVHFDIAPKNVNKVVQATEVVLGDCATNLKQLIPRIQRVSDRPEWYSQIRHWKKRFPLSAYAKHNPSKSIKPQAAIQKLSEMADHMKDRVIISTGVGQHQMWAAQHYRWRHPRTMLTSGGLGTMGYGLPAAIGAKVARPDCLVIDIDGDASLSMSLAELATAARYNIAVKVLLLNNEGMGMVSDLQRMYYAERFAHCRQENPDFVLASQGFGVAADRVVSPAYLEQKLTWLIEHDGPALLEVVTERNTPVWPVVPSGKGLHDSSSESPNSSPSEVVKDESHGSGGNAAPAVGAVLVLLLVPMKSWPIVCPASLDPAPQGCHCGLDFPRPV
ncbi:putative acetolactate synthase, large subunit, biosynthetic (Eurofung) [Ilyonectria robusta]